MIAMNKSLAGIAVVGIAIVSNFFALPAVAQPPYIEGNLIIVPAVSVGKKILRVEPPPASKTARAITAPFTP